MLKNIVKFNTDPSEGDVYDPITPGDDGTSTGE